MNSHYNSSLKTWHEAVRRWCTFFGLSSTSVILEGSTMGLGLRRFSIRLCHCVGRPTKQPLLASKEVWTRCSKFLGADISGLFFFFLRNILRSTGVTVCPLGNVPAEKSIQPIINCAQYMLQHLNRSKWHQFHWRSALIEPQRSSQVSSSVTDYLSMCVWGGDILI